MSGRVCGCGHVVGQHELRSGGRLGCFISGCLCIDFEEVAPVDPLAGWCNFHQRSDCGDGDSPSRHDRLAPVCSNCTTGCAGSRCSECGRMHPGSVVEAPATVAVRDLRRGDLITQPAPGSLGKRSDIGARVTVVAVFAPTAAGIPVRFRRTHLVAAGPMAGQPGSTTYDTFWAAGDVLVDHHGYEALPAPPPTPPHLVGKVRH